MSKKSYWQMKSDYHQARAKRWERKIDEATRTGKPVTIFMREALMKHIVAATQAQTRADQ